MKKVTKKLIAIRIRPSTEKQLQQLAEEKEMSLSELARMIIENYLLSR